MGETSIVVVVPTDGCSAVAVAAVLGQMDIIAGACSADFSSRAMLVRQADEVRAGLSAMVRNQLQVQCVLTWEQYRHHLSAFSVLCVGLSGGIETYVAMPNLARYSFDFSYLWALYAQAEFTRQYMAHCTIAKLQTIGGGWASLRRSDKALECAMQLYDAALSVSADDITSKCRVFIGWAHLWNGNVAGAIQLFQLELESAIANHDEEHERRCRHAIINAETNPTLSDPQNPGRYSLTDCWERAFASEDILPMQTTLVRSSGSLAKCE